MDDLEWITPAQLFGAITKYNDYHLAKEQHEFERTRLIGFWQMVSMGSKINKPEDLVKFPWEEKSHGKIKSIKIYGK